MKLLTCTVCGNSYWTHRYRAARSKFCSKSCWSNRGHSNFRICPNCGLSFGSSDNRQRFCTRQCSMSYMVGPKAAAWKDGSSLCGRGIYRSAIVKWRWAVYARDGYRCVRCKDNGYLHAHHIKSWSEFPNLRFDISNGETLCIACHGKEHGKNFENRRNKNCPHCGCKTKGRGDNGTCASCAITLWHRRRHALS